MDKNKLSILESLLFAVAKSLSYKELVEYFEAEDGEVKELVEALKEKYNTDESGIHVMVNNGRVQFMTNPKNGEKLHEYFEDELSKDLSKPSLETLTIIAYRQPISKEELEQIRGVNCSLILRNLLIRGFVDAKDDQGGLTTTYSVTMDFLRYLGISEVSELPKYDELNSNSELQKLLSETAVEAEKDTLVPPSAEEKEKEDLEDAHEIIEDAADEIEEELKNINKE